MCMPADDTIIKNYDTAKVQTGENTVSQKTALAVKSGMKKTVKTYRGEGKRGAARVDPLQSARGGGPRTRALKEKNTVSRRAAPKRYRAPEGKRLGSEVTGRSGGCWRRHVQGQKPAVDPTPGLGRGERTQGSTAR